MWKKFRFSQFKKTFLKHHSFYMLWYHNKILCWLWRIWGISHPAPKLSQILSLILYRAQKLASANLPYFAQECKKTDGGTHSCLLRKGRQTALLFGQQSVMCRDPCGVHKNGKRGRLKPILDSPRERIRLFKVSDAASCLGVYHISPYMVHGKMMICKIAITPLCCSTSPYHFPAFPLNLQHSRLSVVPKIPLQDCPCPFPYSTW